MLNLKITVAGTMEVHGFNVASSNSLESEIRPQTPVQARSKHKPLASLEPGDTVALVLPGGMSVLDRVAKVVVAEAR